MANNNQTIGSINGRWARLFQVLMVLWATIVPLMIAHASWVTIEIFSNRERMAVINQRMDGIEGVAGQISNTLNEMRVDLRALERAVLYRNEGEP